jgi:hypothetical protein
LRGEIASPKRAMIHFLKNEKLAVLIVPERAAI